MSELPESGQMRLYDNYEPGLAAGKYTVTAKQTVGDRPINVDKDGITPVTNDDVRVFHIEGPRFHLGPRDVHAVFPPAQSSADYSRDLPHIVLRRRSLPWDRFLGREGNLPVPWLALLVLRPEDFPDGILPVRTQRAIRDDDDDDIERLRDPADRDQDPGRPARTSARIKDKVHLPALDLEGTLTAYEIQRAADKGMPAPKVTTIDLDAQIFLDIIPNKEELPFLAHVREVSTGAKEILDLPHDGWFSVVIGNRLPTPANDGTPPSSGRHAVHLVSLEGWQDWIPFGIRTVAGEVNVLDMTGALNLRSLHPDLRRQFVVNGIELDRTARVEVKEVGRRWTVVDSAGTYLLVQTGEHTLHVYRSKDVHEVYDNPDEQRQVRLVSLASWEFTSTPVSNDSFEALAGDLDVAPLRYTAWSAYPDPEGTASTEVGDALQQGYVPLNYSTRLGEPTIGWYRGPLLPHQVNHLAMDPYESAEAALIYDPNTGLFDVSYAVAWQLGRLLALSDRHFIASQVLLWQAESRRLQDLVLERRRLMARYIALLNLESKELAKAISLLNRQQMLQLIGLFLQGRVMPGIQDGILSH